MPEHTEHLPEPLPAEPLGLVSAWLEQAWAAGHQPNANAMVLATTGADGQPSARVVLCKGIVPTPGYIVFYTNYLSSKGRQLTDNARAAVVMHWDALHRQVRMEGPVVRSPAPESDAYFASRSWQKRIAAWASAQSEPVASRAQLHENIARAAARFGTPLPGSAAATAATDFDIPRPPHWGGYRLWPQALELWVEGDARLHDRARWQRTLSAAADGFACGPWSATRLQP